LFELLIDINDRSSSTTTKQVVSWQICRSPDRQSDRRLNMAPFRLCHHKGGNSLGFGITYYSLQ